MPVAEAGQVNFREARLGLGAEQGKFSALAFSHGRPSFRSWSSEGKQLSVVTGITSDVTDTRPRPGRTPALTLLEGRNAL